MLISSQCNAGAQTEWHCSDGLADRAESGVEGRG